ncbi:hypothetical protein POPTR_001G349700v4 [Populus trichocarpa]|jgi:hypothetical protein|uniref:Uncharacterized protein n=1 Tax=Populus trichocarpa TaxID=3694 RepID=B9GHQ4_POPTR|nr:uncharacterized protein LOC7487851 [Populus trichocarpa]PNT58361.1 hypothetical protein POPTR_001G349700v4 [Populus trichocarpa]|eukprot:XP_002300032.1 uncharacterized protein LOC7487851 [Populus trichocarpa]
MEENPPRVSSQERTHEVSRGGPTRKSRHAVDEGGDLIECSSKHCQSCTAGLVADCVALCCCPCALVNLLTLAFVKVPWMIGRRCLGRVKRKKMKLEIKRKCRKNSEGEGNTVAQRERDCNLRKRMIEEEGVLGIATGFGEEEEMASVTARYEAERLWFELNQIGHLGFGRVSFTDNPCVDDSLGK